MGNINSSHNNSIIIRMKLAQIKFIFELCISLNFIYNFKTYMKIKVTISNNPLVRLFL